MVEAAAARPASPARPGAALAQGFVTAYLSVIVLLPLAAVVWRAGDGGRRRLWEAISNDQALAALKLTLAASVAVAVINAVMGTVIAWILVRDRFRGQSVVNAVIDLPFALPTVVAGLTLLALYGPNGPVGVNVAYTRTAILLALLFVTLPFRTEVASVYIFGRIESGDPQAAAAISTVLLAISLAVLFGIGGLRRWATRHERA